MDMMAGRKETDVGTIPADWDVVEAFELRPFITSGSRGWAKHYSDRGDLFMRITNLSRESIYPDLSDIKLVDLPKNDPEGLRTALADGDILVSITADIGIIGYVTAAIPKPAYINQHIACLRLPADKADSRFQSYFLASHGPQKRFAEMTDVGAKSGINLTTVGKLKLLSPPLPEQRAIAAALVDADELIASLDALMAKKRDLKKAAMQQLLTGKTRLSGFTGEWVTKRLGSVASIRNEKISTLANDVASFCVELEQIGQNTGQIEGHSDARGRRAVKYHFQKDDVLFGRLRPYLRKFWRADREGVCSTEIWPLVPLNGQMTPSFLFQTVRTETFIEAANSSYGTHMPRSDWKALEQLEVHLPSDQVEQAAIAEVLSEMDAELFALEKQTNKARVLKQGMTQELLTGRIRLA